MNNYYWLIIVLNALGLVGCFIWFIAKRYKNYILLHESVQKNKENTDKNYILLHESVQKNKKNADKNYILLHESIQKNKEDADEKFNKIAEQLKPLSKIDERVNILYKAKLNINLTQAQSPVQLTEQGEEIAKDLESYALIEKYKNEFKQKMNNIADLNPYRIQQECKRVIENYFKDIVEDSLIKSIENRAFNEGILFDDLLSIYIIILRNKILAEKGIEVKTIAKDRS